MIKIMPLNHLVTNKIDKNKLLSNKLLSNYDEKKLIEIIGNNFYFTSSGKESIEIIMKNEKLTRSDEVFITTTTDSSFVSTCVSATIFNYAKISRVLTVQTKVIYIIHNFGFPHPDLLKLRKVANERNIVLVEDCAFAFDSYTKNIRLGEIGDYAIYSLPKILPLKYGGILQCNKVLDSKSYIPKQNKQLLSKDITY